MSGRTASSVVTYADGRITGEIVIAPGARIDEVVGAELAAQDESAEAVVLDERGHRLERWRRRGARISREWSLPGVVARAPTTERTRRTSSVPPPR